VLGIDVGGDEGGENQNQVQQAHSMPAAGQAAREEIPRERVRLWPQEQNPHNIWVSTMPSRNGAREAKSPSQGTSNGNATWMGDRKN
jgi:hypothetical protein